jgi:hypothetical protein
LPIGEELRFDALAKLFLQTLRELDVVDMCRMTLGGCARQPQFDDTLRARNPWCCGDEPDRGRGLHQRTT